MALACWGTMWREEGRADVREPYSLISLASVTDRNHAIAVTESEKFLKEKGTIIVPSDVFTESINIMGKLVDHASAMGTATILMQEPAYLIVDTDEEMRKQALEKYRGQNEDVSFTDCMVMACADRFETKAIFGFDKVFKKNGYHALILL
jgi:predicted nucleic acid-binding protein